MIRVAFTRLQDFAHRAYTHAYALHGDLEVEFEHFTEHIRSVVERHLGAGAPEGQVQAFVASLHTDDLYLSVACALKKDVAWGLFISKYQKYIHELAYAASAHNDWAREVRDRVLFDLFLPDGSGRSRIASYDGRSSLATWLRVVVIHQAFKERKRRHNHMESLDCVAEQADRLSLDRMEAMVRTRKYETMILESLEGASQCLSERECNLLLLRYVEELQVSEIARMFSVSPSTITRQLRAVQEKLRRKVIAILAGKYHLAAPAIEECLVDILENPGYSILHYLQKF